MSAWLDLQNDEGHQRAEKLNRLGAMMRQRQTQAVASRRTDRTQRGLERAVSLELDAEALRWAVEQITELLKEAA